MPSRKRVAHDTMPADMRMRAVIAPYRRAAVFMDTLVSVEIIAPPTAAAGVSAVARAFAHFREVEARCNRFDPTSELRALTARVGEAVPVSTVLFEATRFALAVAAASDGAFDPTLGATLARRGFNRDYRTGQTVDAPLPPESGETPSYRDVRLDPTRRTITLTRPLLLDLGAVAKGMAMDLAARELDAFPNYLIEAGGDVRVRGHNARGEAWQIGIQHPREPDAVFATLAITDAAVCTSGDYERPAPQSSEVREVSKGEHHLLDPHAGRSPRAIISATVIAPTAMAADALSTAAFVLGPEAGIAFLEQQGVDGLLVTPALKPYTTEGFARYFL